MVEPSTVRAVSRRIKLVIAGLGAAVALTVGILVTVGSVTNAAELPTTSVSHHARTVKVHRVVAASLPVSPTTDVTTTTPPSVPVTLASSEQAVAALISEVEAAGINPGSNWTWSLGNPTLQCGAIADASVGTGCTSWASGTEKTVFAGAPTLALVAHELANAETANDAVPSLLNQVAAAEAGTSWSPTDAVATCLVAHFLGLNDNAAGTWQCPSALASEVAGAIHETIATSRIDASCGTKSGVVSSLTFVGTAGTLTVTGPTGSADTVTATTPVMVSGIGSFSAVDVGGTASESGACQG